MLNWTWTLNYSGGGAVPGLGYKFNLAAKCRVCPQTKKLLDQNMYGASTLHSASQYRSTISLTSTTSTKIEMMLHQRQNLEKKLLKTWIDGDALREASLIGADVLGQDLSDRFAHPLWTQKNSCLCCQTKDTKDELLAAIAVDLDVLQEERVGFKSLELGSINIRMQMRKEWSTTNDYQSATVRNNIGRPMDTNRYYGGTSGSNHALRHSAGCIVLPKHPTATQLKYLKSRGLIQFAHPEDYSKFSSNYTASSLLNDLEETNIGGATRNIKDLVTVLEINRDQSIIPEDVVFGSSNELTLLRRLVLSEGRKLDFFFPPIGDREKESSNPYDKASVKSVEWSATQNYNMTHWRSVELSVDTVELSEDESSALFWCRVQKNQTYFKEMQEKASSTRMLEGSESDLIELGFSSVVVMRSIRLKASDYIKHNESGNNFSLSYDASNQIQNQQQ